jgi:hypothetical protein
VTSEFKKRYNLFTKQLALIIKTWDYLPPWSVNVGYKLRIISGPPILKRRDFLTSQIM